MHLLQSLVVRCGDQVIDHDNANQPANLFSGKPSSTATPYHVHIRRSLVAAKSCWFFDPDYRARSRTHIPFSLVRIYPPQILQRFRIVKMRCLSLQAVCLRDDDWHRRCHDRSISVSGNHGLGVRQEHSLLEDHTVVIVMELSWRDSECSMPISSGWRKTL